MRFIISFVFTLLLFSQLPAQIEFFHGTWQEGLKEAEKTGKPVFVDAYAKWCGPCKRMAKTTFMDKEVGDFFNEKFVNIKLDAETPDGRKFKKKYPVSAYPTLFFIDENGEVLHKVVGGQDVKKLMTNANLALRKVDYSKEYADKYEAGERSPEFLYEYVKSLNKSGKSSLKVTNEYLRTQKDLTSEFNLRFIYEGAMEADSRVFDLMMENQTAIGKLVGLKELRERIELACQSTVDKAVEFEFEEILVEAKNKMKKGYPEKADAFAAKADMDFYLKMNDAEKYGKACADYAGAVAKGNAKEMDKLAKGIMKNFPKHAECMKMAEKFAKSAAGKSKNYAHHLNYAMILNKNGKTKQAKKVAKSALELAAEKDARAAKQVEKFIEKLG